MANDTGDTVDDQVPATLAQCRADPEDPASAAAAGTTTGVQSVDPGPRQPRLTDVEAVKCHGVPRSPHWPAVRAAWLKTHPSCRACGTQDCPEVHHKQPFHLRPELELDPSNFITLCEKPGHCCHFREGHGYDWTKFNPLVEIDADEALARVRRIDA